MSSLKETIFEEVNKSLRDNKSQLHNRRRGRGQGEGEGL